MLFCVSYFKHGWSGNNMRATFELFKGQQRICFWKEKGGMHSKNNLSKKQKKNNLFVYLIEKSRTWETPTLFTDADTSTNAMKN